MKHRLVGRLRTGSGDPQSERRLNQTGRGDRSAIIEQWGQLVRDCQASSKRLRTRLVRSREPTVPAKREVRRLLDSAQTHLRQKLVASGCTPEDQRSGTPVIPRSCNPPS